MRRSAKAFTAVIAIGALLTLAGCTEAASTQSHQAAASSQTATLAAQITTADESEGMAHAELASLQLDVKGMQSVLAARPAFLAAVAKAKASFDAAAGKVDVSAEHQTVLTAQQQVLAERTDPAKVDAATKAVLDAAASVDAKIASSRSQPASHRVSTPAPKAAAPAPAPTPAPASADWFAQMRAILNEVGGSGIQLVQYDGHCGGVVAAACSVQGTVKVNPSIASWSQSRKVWAMTHELAHQYQFKVWACSWHPRRTTRCTAATSSCSPTARPPRTAIRPCTHTAATRRSPGPTTSGMASSRTDDLTAIRGRRPVTHLGVLAANRYGCEGND